MTLPPLHDWTRWATFAVLLLVLAPGQMVLQMHHYADLSFTEDMKLLLQIVSAGICLVEAFALPVMMAAMKRGEAGRALLFAGLAFLPMLALTLLADVGAVATQLDRDQLVRESHRHEQRSLSQSIEEADVQISALSRAIPAVYQGRPLTSLATELQGLDARLATYAVPPQGLMRTQMLVASVLETRKALDQAVAAREALRERQTPPVADNHAQVEAIIAWAGYLGWQPSAEAVRAFLPLFYALTLKLVLICGFFLVTPHTGAARQHQAAPAMAGATAVATPASPASSSTPLAPLPTANPQVAGLLQRGLKRPPKKPAP